MHVTRIEAHLSDENGKKEGKNMIVCLLEARLKGRQPIAVSDQSVTVESSVSGDIHKLKASLDTLLGHIKNY